jgi:glycosyltransferase involved in cell wall biosynthesis
MTTLGRTTEIERLLHSLEAQTYRHLELVIVDQNDDQRLAPIIEAFSAKLAIERITSGRGAARGRNAGLARIRGDIVGFPDDDCEYPVDMLERVRQRLVADPHLDIVTGAAADWNGDPVGRWDPESGPLTLDNVWRRGIAFNMFIRRSAMNQLGLFDEMLGPGSGTRFGAGEETELLVRAIRGGSASFYDPTLIALHPNKQFTDVGITRAFGYGAGVGYVLRKHRCPLSNLLTVLIRPFGGALIAVARGRMVEARYHLATLRGRSWGYLTTKPSPVRPDAEARTSHAQSA